MTTITVYTKEIDEYGIKKPTPLNEEVVVEFVADKAGKLKYYYSMLKPPHDGLGRRPDRRRVAISQIKTPLGGDLI